MDIKAKMILTAVGLSAVVIPIVLLTVLTKKVDVTSTVPEGQRSINQNIFQNIIKSSPASSLLLPSPSSSSRSANPLPSATGSAR